MVTKKFEGLAPGGWHRRILEMISDPFKGAANWAIPGERFDIPSTLPVNRISKELTGYNLDELSQQDTVNIIPSLRAGSLRLLPVVSSLTSMSHGA